MVYLMCHETVIKFSNSKSDGTSEQVFSSLRVVLDAAVIHNRSPNKKHKQQHSV